ncbi:MAG: RHS repeat protein [Lachnospiraceae bacterium]|nr:RHS repeat protein [Lachnospiraceae bacterium]
MIYDREGNAIKHTKRSGKEVSYSYDYLGNIVKTEGETNKCEYIYDICRQYYKGCIR